MATCNIFFVNKYSQPGQYQDYSFFSDLPKVAPNPTGAPIHSNVFQSTTLTRNEDWSIGMTSTHYAWCGTTDKKLAANAKIDRSMSKLAALGNESAPGSTLKMINKAGSPAFRSTPALTTNAGSFAIETGNDFDANTGFVFGYGATDGEGRLKSLVTMDASANATVNIVPATRFYLAAHSSSVGTMIDATVAFKNAASIDFTKNAGMYGAIVIHEANGGFSVKYTSQADFTKAVEVASEPAPEPKPAPASRSTEVDPRDVELAQLRQQVQQMQIQLYAALNGNRTSTAPDAPSTNSAPSSTTQRPLPPTTTSTTPTTITPPKDPYPTTKPATTWYKATLPFRNTPGQSRRRDIRDRLTTHMASHGYTYEGGSIDSNLVAMYSHSAGCYGAWHSVRQASSDWSDASASLPRHLRQYVGEEVRMCLAQESRGLWRVPSSSSSSGNGSVRGGMSHGGRNSVNGFRHERESSTGAVKVLTNGVVEHKRESSRGSGKVLTNGVKAVNGVSGARAVNGVSGVHHDRSPVSSTSSRSSTPTKHLTNGVTAEAVKPPVNGVNGVSGKYDYPHGEEDPVMKAKKMRARQVLIDEGLEEYASGWKVPGY
ncbi:hypothetical protein PMZ80_002545 [Knufia obscura]|uniref:Uncharacterized protein n=1 Tax=Knufia obscura TaxID=1635080 RepID=A0ABR0RXM0_9EURO|nr:hypothetical protein PMZ80_002545 [Knufia obscura]